MRWPEGGLRHTIASVPPTALNSQVAVRNRPLGPVDYQNLKANVLEIGERRVGSITRDIQRWGKARPYPGFSQPPDQGAEPILGNPRVQMFFLTGFQERSRLSDGTWPRREPVLDARGVSLDVVVGTPLARSMGLRLENEIFLSPFPTDPSELITLVVSGFADPIDSRDEYWMGTASSYFNVELRGEQVILPMYLDEEHFFDGLGARYPSLVGDYGWFFFLETDLVTGANVDATQENLEGLETDIGKRYPQSLVFTGLGNALADYKQDLTMARAPLLLFLLLIVAVMLYFLALVVGLLTRSRSDEAGLFRSRGASMPQMTGLLALGEGVIVLLSVVIGPLRGPRHSQVPFGGHHRSPGWRYIPAHRPLGGHVRHGGHRGSPEPGGPAVFGVGAVAHGHGGVVEQSRPAPVGAAAAEVLRGPGACGRHGACLVADTYP